MGCMTKLSLVLLFLACAAIVLKEKFGRRPVTGRPPAKCQLMATEVGKLGNRLVTAWKLLAMSWRFNRTACITEYSKSLMELVVDPAAPPALATVFRKEAAGLASAARRVCYPAFYAPTADQEWGADVDFPAGRTTLVHFRPIDVAGMEGHRDRILEAMPLRQSLSDKAAAQLKTLDSRSGKKMVKIAFHVRRREKVNWAEVLSGSEFIGPGHLVRLMEKILLELGLDSSQAVFVVASDDPDWCRANLSPAHLGVAFADDLCRGDKACDFALVASCHHGFFLMETFGYAATFYVAGRVFLPDHVTLAGGHRCIVNEVLHLNGFGRGGGDRFTYLSTREDEEVPEAPEGREIVPEVCVPPEKRHLVGKTIFLRRYWEHPMPPI